MEHDQTTIEELFQSVLAAAQDEFPMLETRGERDAWLSSALGLWREPGVADNAAADDASFQRGLDSRHDQPTANAMAAALRDFWTDPTNEPQCLRAWVDPDDVRLVILEFDDGSDAHKVAGQTESPVAHALLIGCGSRGELVDIHFAIDIEPLIATAAEDGTAFVAVEPQDAMNRVAKAVDELAANPGEPDDRVLSSICLVRARLGTAGFGTVDPVFSSEIPEPPTDDLADRHGLSTLRAALKGKFEKLSDDESRHVRSAAELVRWDGAVGRPITELEGLATLEWADWLGAIIGTVRGGAATEISGPIRVDRVNQCPEVTSQIPKAERQWFEWVFATVVESWRELGFVDAQGLLTEVGRRSLPWVLIAAWSNEPIGLPDITRN